MSTKKSYRISHMQGYYPLYCYKADITFHGYKMLHAVRRSTGTNFIHFGVGNPTGGWAMRITEAPTSSVAPGEIPTGIWVFPEQLAELRESLRDVLNLIPKCYKDKKLCEDGFKLISVSVMPSGNSPLLLSLMMVDHAWLLKFSDARGNQILLNEEEILELIETSRIAEVFIHKKISNQSLSPVGYFNQEVLSVK